MRIKDFCPTRIQEKNIAFLLSFIYLALLLSSCARRVEEPPVVFYPKPPALPRLQFLTAISSEQGLKPDTNAFKEFLLGPDLDIRSIGRPYDVSSSPGKIYIVDRSINKILVVNLITKRFEILQDSRKGILRAPAGIWVSEDGLLYVTDMLRKQVVVFAADNSFIRTYGDDGIFEKPVDVAVYKDQVYVCDMVRNHIVVLDKTSGRLLKTVGTIGTAEGQVYKPTHITLDASGSLYINDAFNFRVQKFDTAGNFVKTIGFHGDRIGAMARTKGLDLDRDGNLYVADAAFEYVQLFNDKEELLMFFGGPGVGPGNLYLPAGVHVDYDNIEYFKSFADKEFQVLYLLYVCNMTGPNKLNVYGFGEWLGN